MGSASLFVFTIQAVTGALLAMNYVPSPDHAYDSVKFIGEHVVLGHFIRGLHHWGASFMVVLVVLHMLRVYFMGAYKYPREGTWMIGIFLLLLVMGFGFTGYLLPWDQKAYWATAVGTNIAGQTPILGPALAKLLKGGSEMGVATLTRFYALHVLVLPALAMLLIGIHLFLVVWHGISEPPSRTQEGGGSGVKAHVLDWHARYRRRYRLIKAKGKPFFPYTVFKDALVSLIVFAVLSFFALHFGAKLEDLADPTASTYNPRPEWYFLFIFQALKVFPGRLESVAAVVLPGVAVLLLFLLPILDRDPYQRLPDRPFLLFLRMPDHPVRHPLDRPFWTILGVLALGLIGALTYFGLRSPLLNPIVQKDPLVQHGQRLYRDLNCTYCHKIAGEGGRVGPRLDIATAGQSEGWLKRHFRDPRSITPGSAMPKLNLLDDEIDALTAYVESLVAAPYTKEAPKLFAANCAVCHRIGKEGGEVGPDLSRIGAARDKTFINRYVTDPKVINLGTVMPTFRGQLTDVQIEDLSRYLASLGR